MYQHQRSTTTEDFTDDESSGSSSKLHIQSFSDENSVDESDVIDDSLDESEEAPSPSASKSYHIASDASKRRSSRSRRNHKKKNILESDSEEEENDASKSSNSRRNRNLKKKNIIETDSEEEQNVLSFNTNSKSKSRLCGTSEDDDTDDAQNDFGSAKMKKQTAAVIPSDSHDGKDTTDDTKNIDIVGSSSDSEQSLHSIYDSHIDAGEPKREETSRISKDFKYDTNRISNDFRNADGKEIYNSTTIDAVQNVLEASNKKYELNVGSSTLKNTNILLEGVIQPVQVTNVLTPRVIKHEFSIESSEDIIEVSSSDEDSFRNAKTANKTLRQTTLDPHITSKTTSVKPLSTNNSNVLQDEDVVYVNLSIFKEQKEKVESLEKELLKAKEMLRSINAAALPDKGNLLLQRHYQLEQAYMEEKKKLSNMDVPKDSIVENTSNLSLKELKNTSWENVTPGINQDIKNISWDDIMAGVGAVQPKTQGAQAMATYNAQKALTVGLLEQIHSSLARCPSEDTVEHDPKGMKVELMPHQKRALAWLMWREEQKPPGGILADDMGLGKTLTMISLILKNKELKRNNNADDSDENTPARRTYKPKGGTLIVCPASLLNQWSGELERRLKRGLLSYVIYHGPKRESKAKRLAEYDVVITTYAITMNENERNGTLFQVRWERIILDEAHQIRNYKSQTSVAVCRLSSTLRWALTGTPVQNKELDMFALLKFLRCSPFDDLVVWRRWVGDKSTGGQERLHTVISSLLLRRTKAELITAGSLNAMPERTWDLVRVNLTKNEMGVYQKVLLFSQTLFAQFLHQRAEKNQDMVDLRYDKTPGAPNAEYMKMREKLLKMNKVKHVSQHEILVLILRLRQICVHPFLITKMLEGAEELSQDEEDEEQDLISQLDNMNLNESLNSDNQISNERVALQDAAKGFLKPTNAVFAPDFLSSKIKAVLDTLNERILPEGDKVVIVSQWPSLLRLIGDHLRQQAIQFMQLDGSVPVAKRMVIVDDFNNPGHKVQVMLLSLTAGGVGLNLIGANHLLLLDLHWNPQLENQAQDRIYRMGQKKPVYIYKFMAVDTIEERIKRLQEAKLEIANAMLTGSKQAVSSKLSLQDIKMLFNMS